MKSSEGSLEVLCGTIFILQRDTVCCHSKSDVHSSRATCRIRLSTAGKSFVREVHDLRKFLSLCIKREELGPRNV